MEVFLLLLLHQTFIQISVCQFPLSLILHLYYVLCLYTKKERKEEENLFRFTTKSHCILYIYISTCQKCEQINTSSLEAMSYS